ncbi:MAG: hypothetical protein B6I36_02765 [Desulfobacteraceae bacterium 4572_35.1]|nr:MAG: hypothetical protein B6I36_02765 [Desulfobacteraceae bacterium 4572_35.1]
MKKMAKYVYVGVVLITLLPWTSPALALCLGIVYGLTFVNPWPKHTATISRNLLQFSVVGMGFGVPIAEVWRVGSASFVTTLTGIIFTLSLGLMLGKLLKIETNTSMLVACGTAICGGSAIAAITPVIRARHEQAAVALATVFTLNAVALLLFPAIGHHLNMAQHQFGVWAGMAIHDTSSVVGAAASYGQQALEIATTVKLTRAMWIAPLAMVIGMFFHSDKRAKIPLFILAFIGAAALHTVVPTWQPLWHQLAAGARQTLVVSLFFIGSGLNRTLLRQVGLKTFVQGTLLWVAVSTATLLALRAGIIG